MSDIDAKIDALGKEKLVTSISCTTFSNIEPQEIDWLWYERIAIGKVTVIAGDPGLGKSLITSALASHVSNGAAWPVDRATCEAGDVLILSAEDDPDDTIRPRLDAAGADVSKVHYVGLVNDYRHDGTPYKRGFDIDTDLDLIERLIKSHPGTRVVSIDPVSAFLGKTDSHNNAQMRGLLAPLSALAAKYKIAIILVTHLNKGSATNAMHRITGSLALVAAARASYLVSKDPDNPVRRLMLPMKNNLGGDLYGFAYSIAVAENGAPYVLWEDKLVEVTADDVLNNVDESDEDTPARDEAKAWILAQLENGAVPSKEIFCKARQDGIAKRTLDRAKSALEIESTRKDGHWSWIAPDGTYKTKNANACDHVGGNLRNSPESHTGIDSKADKETKNAKSATDIGAGKVGIVDREDEAQSWRDRL